MDALAQFDTILELLAKLGVETRREHLGGELSITLLKDLGTGIEVHDMDTELVIEAIQWLKERQRD